MFLTLFIIVAILSVVALIFIIKKVRTKLHIRAAKKRAARKSAIEPSVTFYLKKGEPLNQEDRKICIKNTGQFRAINISIKDFHHPEEKNWVFKFEKIPALDPGEEKTVDFKFIVAEIEASNRFDQLWMFDPAHDHDFAAKVILSYHDIDGNRIEKTITIGKNKKSKISRQKLIQTMLSRDRFK